MMFLWQPQMIRFMRDASEYGTYHRTIASRVLERVSPKPRVCDAGCGLGYLSLAFAPYSASVTSVDINSDVLALLNENAAKRGLSNISTVCGKAEEMPDELRFDVMAFCFFGNSETILSTVQKCCDGKAFVIKRRLLKDEPAELARNAVDLEQVLTKRGVPFRSEYIDTRLDQPFTSESDALLFYETYKQKEPYKSMTKDEYLNKLETIDAGAFKLVYPIEKHLLMVEIESRDLRL